MNKRIPFAFFFAFLLLLSSTGCAPALDNQYQDIVTNSLHEIESSQSLNEAAPFQCILFSPNDFVLTVGNDIHRLDQVLMENGLNTSYLPSLSTTQAKYFTFWGVPVSDTLCDVVVIRYGYPPSTFAVVFLRQNGEWLLTNVLPDVESVEIADGLTNTWLKIRTSAFADSVQIERLYNLSSRKYEVCYASRDTSPAYGMDMDDVVLLNAYSIISEYSIVDGTESVYTCDLYVVRNISLCTIESEAVTEHSTSTDIDLYTYSYENKSFIWQCTNHYEGRSRCSNHSRRFIQESTPFRHSSHTTINAKEAVITTTSFRQNLPTGRLMS